MATYHRSDFSLFSPARDPKIDQSGFIYTDVRSVLMGDWSERPTYLEAQDIAKQNVRAVITAVEIYR